MRARGITLLEMMTILFLIAVLAAIVVPSIHRANRNSRVTQCCGNIAQLWKMQDNYSVRYGGHDRRFPHETGPQFWLKLTRPEIELIDSTLRDMLQCPVEGINQPGTCDYRGPAQDIHGYGDGEPVGADRIDNHDEGGNVLRKSGDVQSVGSRDSMWALAAQKLR